MLTFISFTYCFRKRISSSFSFSVISAISIFLFFPDLPWLKQRIQICYNSNVYYGYIMNSLSLLKKLSKLPLILTHWILTWAQNLSKQEFNTAIARLYTQYDVENYFFLNVVIMFILIYRKYSTIMLTSALTNYSHTLHQHVEGVGV